MKLLMMEGNTLESQNLARSLNVRTATEIYTKALLYCSQNIEIDVVNAAEGDMLPHNKRFCDYDGMVISGSSLRAFEDKPEVKRQLELLERFGETGKPILGSCWGLQIATVVAGGTVSPSDKGQELGLARKIYLTEEGEKHPLYAGKPKVFDAPCIHYDEVTELPEGSTLLSSNHGAIIPVGNSEFWGVQYHPEFDIAQLRMLFTLYKDNLLEQGFVNNDQEHERLIKAIATLESNPEDKATAWQLGFDADVLNDYVRSIEIRNWLKHVFVS